MTTAEQVAALLSGGATVVLQRAARGVTAEALAEFVGGHVATDPFEPGAGGRVVDARTWRDFTGWDVRRGELERAARASPLVLLLDVASSQALLRDAPQTASWAGGVWLPPDPAARPARTEEEFALGARALAEALGGDPIFAATHRGELVAVDLLTRRLFAPTGDASAVDHAREHLDEGILHVGRVP